jgi:hypothetical protein
VIDPHGRLPEKSGRAVNKEEKQQQLETATVLCCAVLCCAVLRLIIAGFVGKSKRKSHNFHPSSSDTV